MLFLSEVVKTDVTVVKLLDNYILVGAGNFLSVYGQGEENNLLSKIKIFDGRKIHGIEINDCRKNIFTYAGCYMNKLSYSSDRAPQFNSLCSEEASDWILTAKWLDNNSIAVVLMLNKLIIYNEELVKEKEIICDDKCMLYSACLYYKTPDELVVFSGTVFGEILIWKVSQYEATKNSPVSIKLNGHKGVIFSVNYNESAGSICSSSDDRSTIVWSIDNKSICNELRQIHPKITLKYKLYGHHSRVFRSIVINRLVMTAGEDSYINVWSLDDGQLLKKIETHQGSPVWTLDSNEKLIVSGGGDCGVLSIPLHLHQNDHHQSVLPDNKVPKRLGILQNNNLVAIAEDGSFYHLVYHTKTWKKISQHDDLKSYSLLEVSLCRRLVSLAGYHGELYVYKEQGESMELLCFYKIIRESRIFSFHWLSCETFLTCEKDGLLTLWYLQNGTVYSVCTFILPEMKDVWTTAACQIGNGGYVVGDRKGNIYVYALSSNNKPKQIFRRVHNYLGVTKIYNFGDKVISIGRNAIVQTFTLKCKKLLTVSSDKVPFTWLSGMVDRFLLAFSGNNFIVWDYGKRRTVFQHNCGGGHRSWDFYKKGDLTIFSYIKDHILNIVEYDETKMCPVNITTGYHTKIINSMVIFKTDPDNYVILSGSEDTNLRLCLIQKSSFSVLKNLKSHLSSIRTICSYAISEVEHLVFSGGGREQVICWKISLDPAVCNKNMCREEDSYYEKPTDEMSETRIMDLKAVKLQNRLLLLAATSEGNINIFSISENDGKHKISFMRRLIHKHKCITKICVIKNILISLSTDGNLTFWDISYILTSDLRIIPFRVINVHQSGINSYSYKMVKDDLFVFLTGGDDNSINLNLFQLTKNESVEVATIATFQDCGSHCAQITGAFICDNYFFTTSIDQRLMVFKWKISKEQLICSFLSRYDSAVADIQGLLCRENFDYFDVFLYGKGVEYVKCIKNKT